MGKVEEEWDATRDACHWTPAAVTNPWRSTSNSPTPNNGPSKFFSCMALNCSTIGGIAIWTFSNNRDSMWCKSLAGSHDNDLVTWPYQCPFSCAATLWRTWIMRWQWLCVQLAVALFPMLHYWALHTGMACNYHPHWKLVWFKKTEGISRLKYFTCGILPWVKW